MAGDIKRRIVLEGEKEYNSALKDIQRNLKTMRSELKAESAELGKNATEQQKAEIRAKSAAAQIKEQEKAVKILEEALGKAKEDYSDNEEVIAKWQQKLNEARTTLAQMRDGLYDMGDGFRQSKSDAELTAIAAKQVGDALGEIGSVGESVAGAIEGFFSGMIHTIESAVMAMWGLVSESAARANNWTDLASYYGSTAIEMQKWSNAIEAANGEFEKFATLINTFAFGGKADKITEWFQISDVNYQDKLKYTVDVLQRMADVKDEMMASGTWDDAMSDIFGTKRAADASWFISNWGDILEKLPTFDAENGGFGMSEEGLGMLNEVAITSAEIETKWASIKDSVAEVFAKHTLDLQTNVSGGLDAINDFIKAENQEEREAALEKLRTNVEEFFRKVGEIISAGIAILGEVGEELKESGDPVAQTIGNILTALKDALEWIVNNQEAVKEAFYVIFAVCLMGHLTAAAGKLSSVLLQIKAIQGFKGLSLGSGAAQAAGSAAQGAAAAAGNATTAGAAAAGSAASAGVETTAGSAAQWGGLLKGLSFAALWKTANELYEQTDPIAVKRNQMKEMREAIYVGPNGETYTADQLGDMVEALKNSDFVFNKDTTAQDIISAYLSQLDAEQTEQTEQTQSSRPRGGRVKKITGVADDPERTAREKAEAEEQALRDEQMAIMKAEAAEHAAELERQEEEARAAAKAPSWAEITAAQAQRGAAEAAPELPEDKLRRIFGFTNDQEFVDAFGKLIDELAEKKKDSQYPHAFTPEDLAEYGMTVADMMALERMRKEAEERIRQEEQRIDDLTVVGWADDGEEEVSMGGAVPTSGTSAAQAQRDAAEAFWDAYKAAEGNANEEAASAAFDVLWELYADQIDVLEALAQKIDDLYMDENGRTMEDLPPSWFTDAAAWQNAGGSNGVTSSDLANFRSLPGSLAAAVKSGAAAGVSGIRVYMDGAEVGRLVAPYVSEEVARDILV